MINVYKSPISKEKYANLFLDKIPEDVKNVCLLFIGHSETVHYIMSQKPEIDFTVIDGSDVTEALPYIYTADNLKSTVSFEESDCEDETFLERLKASFENYNINNMSFDLIIANPPYGKSSSLSKKIVNTLLENKVADEMVVLAPTNTYKIPELKYVQSIVRVDGNALFEDASIYDLCLTRMTKEIGPYKDYASLVLDEKELDLYRNIRVYNESHPTHFKVEKDFMGCKKYWNRMFAFSFAINNGGSTDVKPWSEIVDLTPYTEKHQGPTADIKFNFGNDFEAYYNNLRGNVSYPRLIDMGSTQEKDNFKNWYYKAGKLVNTIRSIISQCENITPRPQCYIDYLPHVDWSHPWTDQEILKEIGLPEDFLEKEENENNKI